MARRYWLVLTACLILAAAAAAHGWRTDRWGATADLRSAAERLDTLPLRVGDWDGVVVELPAAQVAATNVAGLTARRYTHRYTRAEVTVLILCGRPGPVAVHTPDVCYGNAGYKMGPVRTEPLTGDHTAWVADFSKPGGQAEPLRIRWAWSDGGAWVASGSPRTSFARSRVLYKMYLVRSLSPKADPAVASAEIDLMKELLPTLQTTLSAR